MRLAAHEATIAAPIETVWELLTTAAGLVRGSVPRPSRTRAGDTTTARFVHHRLPLGAVEDHERG